MVGYVVSPSPKTTITLDAMLGVWRVAVNAVPERNGWQLNDLNSDASARAFLPHRAATSALLEECEVGLFVNVPALEAYVSAQPGCMLDLPVPMQPNASSLLKRPFVSSVLFDHLFAGVRLGSFDVA